MSAAPRDVDTTPSAHAPRLDSLTGLRWWAAFAVFAHHMGNVAPLPIRDFLTFGNYGVAFFFILSGFVLTWSARPGLPVTTFWSRRLARIWPAHLVALLLAIPVFYSLAPDPANWWVRPFDPGVLALSLVVVQGWWRDPAILFSGNPAAWTLTCEAFFYALHPALLRGVRNVGHRGALVATAAVVAVAVLLRVVILASPDSAVAGAPWPILRLTEFAIGIGVARAMRLGWRPRLRPGAGYLLLAALLGTAHAFPGSPMVAFTNEAVIVLFALLIGAVATRDMSGRPALLRCRPLVVLGEWSYAFYLVHATAIYAVLALAGPRPASWDNLLWYPPLLGLGVGLAAALHVLVERPAERWLRNRWDLRRRPMAAAVGPLTPG